MVANADVKVNKTVSEGPGREWQILQKTDMGWGRKSQKGLLPSTYKQSFLPSQCFNLEPWRWEVPLQSPARIPLLLQPPSTPLCSLHTTWGWTTGSDQRSTGMGTWWEPGRKKGGKESVRYWPSCATWSARKEDLSTALVTIFSQDWVLLNSC